MGVHIGAYRHASCSDQGFKCFARIYHEIDSHLIFLNFKAAHGRFSLLCNESAFQSDDFWKACSKQRAFCEVLIYC